MLTPRERKWPDNCECTTSNGTFDVVHWIVGLLAVLIIHFYTINKLLFLHENPSTCVFWVKKVSYICELLSGWIEILFHCPCSVNLNCNHLFINNGWLIFEFSNMKQACKFTPIRSFTLLILVLSKKTIIVFVKTKPEQGKWQKHDTCVSIAPFSHLLSFAYGLYMTTSTLLNSQLFTEGYIIFLILCIPVPIFHIFLSRNVVLKCCLLLSTPAYMLFWSYETKHWSLKSNLKAFQSGISWPIFYSLKLICSTILNEIQTNRP